MCSQKTTSLASILFKLAKLFFLRTAGSLGQALTLSFWNVQDCTNVLCNSDIIWVIELISHLYVTLQRLYLELFPTCNRAFGIWRWITNLVWWSFSWFYTCLFSFSLTTPPLIQDQSFLHSSSPIHTVFKELQDRCESIDRSLYECEGSWKAIHWTIGTCIWKAGCQDDLCLLTDLWEGNVEVRQLLTYE